VGTLKNYGEDCYNEFSIANTLFLSKVKEWYPVKYDSTNGNKFMVMKTTNEVISEWSLTGLY
jgi:hypothetical protein